ncbi:MAG: DUF481 domain-containing protein [Ginsengibacter sp.]
MRYIICTLVLINIYNTSFSQVVNVESQRIQSDTTGWFGNAGTSFLFEKNAVKVININAVAHVEYKTTKSLYLFLVDYNLLEGNAQTLNNNLFYHLRYNYKINKWLRWEAFTQMQQNNVTGIKLRLLAGTGPRFKLAGSKKLSLYAATSAMYEYEKEQTHPIVYHRDVRSSNYLSLTCKLSENGELVGTVFYQPLYRNFNDYRLLNEITIRFKIAKHFSFTTSWEYLYDSKPAANTPKLNYSISNGIEFSF